jgi:neutral ceramidase
VNVKSISRALAATAVGLITFVAPTRGDTLKAGVAKVDITPAPGLRLWGYSDRKTPATGTLDPLYARVLVLEVGSQRFALVTLDLGRTFGPASLEWLRDATRSEVALLVVAASHTHSGPVVQDEYPAGTPAWEAAALLKIASAVRYASGHMVDARVGSGYGLTYIGHNRLRANSNGTVSWFERNVTQVPTTPVDNTVSVLRVDGTNGQPIAILVNYACHAVVFGSDNLQYSADFPGPMTRTVEEAFDGKPLCFFLQGAAGDINPYYAVTPFPEGALQARDWTSRKLGREVARIAQNIRTPAESSAALQFAEDRLRVRLRWDSKKWREAMIAVFGPEASQTFPSKVPEEIELPVVVVLINKRIAILCVPGEAFVQYQIAWRERCPATDALFVGYADGYNGYFPTIRSAILGGYGAANPATWVEVGAGDRIVDDGVIRINQMLGRFRDLPEDLAK